MGDQFSFQGARVMDIEHDIHIPKGLLLVAIQNFPFKGDHRVLNFFLQGFSIFLVSFALGYTADHLIALACRW